MREHPEAAEPDYGRTYTRGRRQPYLIRKWPNSNWVLPLGPYTITQLLVFVGSVYLLLTYRELTVAVFLAGQESITLPAVVWSYWFSGNRNVAAAVTLILIAVLVPLIITFWWFGRRSQLETR